VLIWGIYFVFLLPGFALRGNWAKDNGNPNPHYNTSRKPLDANYAIKVCGKNCNFADTPVIK